LVLPIVSDPEYSPDTVNVEVQERNRSSLLWFTKRILALRSRHLAFGRGTFEPLLPANPAVLAFIRRYENETLLVVANISRFPQFAELDLQHLNGSVPEEMFGRRPFPKIGELPYLITLGPHTFYWFEIRSAAAVQPQDVDLGDRRQAPQLAEIDVEGEWGDIALGAARTPLERALVGYLPTCRWFRSKALQIQSVEIADAIPLGELLLTVLRVAYTQGDPEEYVLPLRFHVGEGEPERAIARLNVHGTDAAVEGYLTDGASDEAFGNDLLQIVNRRRKRRGRRYRLEGVPGLALRQQDRWRELPPPKPLDVEQSNTSWRYGDQLVAKLYRRVEGGPSPDLVLSRHLSEKANFANIPRLAGHVTIRPEGGAESTLALFQVWVPNQGSAWDLALSQIDELFDLTIAQAVDDDGRRASAEKRLNEVLSLTTELARLLGLRTGQMHAALAQSFQDPEMEAEQFTPFARRSYAQGVRNLAVRNFGLLEKKLDSLPDGATRKLAAEALSLKSVAEKRARDIADVPEGGLLIRCHGDYHLGQVLYTGSDFVILDFEGEPGRSLADRRRKRSPLSDVAGMVRSFQYASEYALRREGPGSEPGANGRAALEPISGRWYAATREAFLGAYLSAVEPIADLLPDAESTPKVLGAFGLEKALYEVGYELNNRPGWVDIPLRGLLALLRGGEES
jgi:maltose alpha-D-glucosyltransferase/alpha-amylase